MLAADTQGSYSYTFSCAEEGSGAPQPPFHRNNGLGILLLFYYSFTVSSSKFLTAQHAQIICINARIIILKWEMRSGATHPIHTEDSVKSWSPSTCFLEVEVACHSNEWLCKPLQPGLIAACMSVLVPMI